MNIQAPQSWRSEAFAEDLSGESGADLVAPAYPWARHAVWLCTLPPVVAVLGGLVAFLQLAA